MSLQQAQDALKSNFPKKEIKWITLDQWKKSEHLEILSYVEVCLVLNFEDYIGAFETEHGSLLLWDGHRWHQGHSGVFLHSVIFVMDYYGYPEGGLFFRRVP